MSNVHVLGQNLLDMCIGNPILDIECAVQLQYLFMTKQDHQGLKCHHSCTPCAERAHADMFADNPSKSRVMEKSLWEVTYVDLWQPDHSGYKSDGKVPGARTDALPIHTDTSALLIRLGAIHLVRTHKFPDFRQPPPPPPLVHTYYDVTMETIHWRTQSA